MAWDFRYTQSSYPVAHGLGTYSVCHPPMEDLCLPGGAPYFDPYESQFVEAALPTQPLMARDARTFELRLSRDYMGPPDRADIRSVVEPLLGTETMSYVEEVPSADAV